MRSHYHRQTHAESALIAGLDHKAKSGYIPLTGHKQKPRPQAPQKKSYRIIDGKIKETTFKAEKQERAPFWDRPKNKKFLTLIQNGHEKKNFFKKILSQRLEHYNKENPHRQETIPDWLNIIIHIYPIS